MNVAIVGGTLNSEALVDQLLMQWEAQPYGELALVVAWLRALAQIHQSHHWQASADPFYGDHLMYDRIYNAIVSDIDKVAEKTVGMGNTSLVDPTKLIMQAQMIMSATYLMRPGIPQPTDLATRSMNAEQFFLIALNRVIGLMNARRLLTPGIDNMLAQIADDHEGHCYLLKQRCAVSM